MDFDDFDPEFHTEDEIRAHYEALYDADPVFRARVDEFADMDVNMDAEQSGLERIADDDPVGAVFFAENDRWWDRRLGGPE